MIDAVLVEFRAAFRLGVGPGKTLISSVVGYFCDMPYTLFYLHLLAKRKDIRKPG